MIQPTASLKTYWFEASGHADPRPRTEDASTADNVPPIGHGPRSTAALGLLQLASQPRYATSEVLGAWGCGSVPFWWAFAALIAERGNTFKRRACLGQPKPIAKPKALLYHSPIADYDRPVAAIRAGLKEEVFAAAWAEGRAMTLEQAIEYALAEANA